MGTPKDWLRESRGIGTYEAPQMQQRAPVSDDPMSDVERMRTRQRAQAEIEAMQEEAEEERELRRLHKQARMLSLQKQIATLNGEGSQGGAAGAEIFRDALQSMQEQQTRLLEELRQARNQNVDSANRTVVEKIAGLQQRIENLSVPKAGDGDAIGILVKQLKAVNEVQSALDAARPPSAHNSEAASSRERLEQLRMDKEYELRKMEVDAQLETARAQRDGIAADRELKTHRMERASQLVENTIGPLIAHLGGEKIAGMMGGAEGTTAAAQAAPGEGMQPFTCPNEACHQVGYVPDGTTFTQCQHCGAEFGLRAATESEVAMEQPGMPPANTSGGQSWNDIAP